MNNLASENLENLEELKALYLQVAPYVSSIPRR